MVVENNAESYDDFHHVKLIVEVLDDKEIAKAHAGFFQAALPVVMNDPECSELDSDSLAEIARDMAEECMIEYLAGDIELLKMLARNLASARERRELDADDDHDE